MGIENSKIRKIILVEHEGLRISIRSLEAVLDQVITGDRAACSSASEQLTALLQSFLRHIEHEELLLAPVLARANGWGPERQRAMQEEHKLQRALVMQLVSVDPMVDPPSWVRDVRIFTNDLLLDMADEEQTSLSPQVLRD